MDIESVRDFCLSLPRVEEYFPFDETTLAFRVEGRIFAMIDLDDTQWFVLKCQPEYALWLRDRYSAITGAWHMNKRHWNQLDLLGQLSDNLVRHLIRHSYTEVVRKLPRAVKQACPEVLQVNEAPVEMA